MSDQVKEMIGKMQAEHIARQRLQLSDVQRDYVFVASAWDPAVREQIKAWYGQRGYTINLVAPPD